MPSDLYHVVKGHTTSLICSIWDNNKVGSQTQDHTHDMGYNEKADLLQGGAVVRQHPGVRPSACGEAGGAVSTGRGRGVAGVLIRGGTLLPLGVLPAAVG